MNNPLRPTFQRNINFTLHSAVTDTHSSQQSPHKMLTANEIHVCNLMEIFFKLYSTCWNFFLDMVLIVLFFQIILKRLLFSHFYINWILKFKTLWRYECGSLKFDVIKGIPYFFRCTLYSTFIVLNSVHLENTIVMFLIYQCENHFILFM